MKLKRRRGSLLLVLTYGTLMVMVVTGMLVLASSLYTTSRDSAKMYSDIQSYRAATELACYQYVTDLQSVVVTKDLDADWISTSRNVVYTRAVEEIVKSLADPNDATVWHVKDVRDAIDAADLSDPSVLVNMLAKMTDVKQVFQLTLPDTIELDWASEDTWTTYAGAQIALKPVPIVIDLEIKSEAIHEEFYVHDLLLSITIDRITMGDNTVHEIATMSLIEKEEGVRILREPLEHMQT